MATSIGSKTSKVFIWIILLLLIIGLGGFGIGGFGRSLNVIGSVGDKEISANRYIETLRQEISAFEQQSGSSISPSEAIKLGLDAQALEKLIATTALDVEASQIGLSVGNKELASYLNKISQFQGPDGNFNQDTYRMVLTQINKNVSDFEQDVREGLTRDMLKDGLSSGGLQTNTYAESIFNYINEERIVKTAILTKNDLVSNIPSPSNADLNNFLSESEERFTVPEVLFAPNMVGMHQCGIAHAIEASIGLLDPDLHSLLYSTVVANGGNTVMPGFHQRLEAELRMLAPDTFDVSVPVGPQASDEAAWRGGMRLAASNALDRCWITKAEYEEKGHHLCRQRFKEVQNSMRVRKPGAK